MLKGKTRIGNWQEELVLEADRKARQTNARGGGELLSQRITSKVRAHNTPCELAPAHPDGFLRFKAPFMLQNAETEGFLSLDIDDRVEGPYGWRIIPTTVPQKRPVLRSTFVIMPVPSDDDPFFASRGESDIVHYGQRFVIQTHPDLLENPMYLCSARKTPETKSRVSGNQFVYLAEEGGQAALWCFDYSSAEYRGDMEGQCVKSDALVVCRHTPTSIPLASARERYANDFGAEWEVCAHRYQRYASKAGNAPEEKPCFWGIVLAPSAAAAAPDAEEAQ